MRILCIDFDDVIFKTKPFIEEIIKKIEYRASAEYLNSIAYTTDDEQTKRILREEHFDLKDRILEEVDDKYKGLIDYEKIFTTKEVYPWAIEYVNYLQNCGLFDKVCILTHCNGSREVKAKLVFINKYFKNLEVIPVPFHKDKYEIGKKRKMTSKAEYFMEYMGITDMSNCTLVDDSATNGRDWKEHGGNFIKYSPTTDVSLLKQEVNSLNPFGINVMSDTVLKLRSGK